MSSDLALELGPDIQGFNIDKIPSWARIAKVEDDKLVLTDDEGQVYKFTLKSMKLGSCHNCNTPVLVEHNMGEMVCPHCADKNITWVWGKAKMLFMPEGNMHSLPPNNPPPKAA